MAMPACIRCRHWCWSTTAAPPGMTSRTWRYVSRGYCRTFQGRPGDGAQPVLSPEQSPLKQKSPVSRDTGLFLCCWQSVVAAHDAEDLQQADKQVVDRHIQADGRHDVVALTAVDDGAGLEQDAHGGKQHKACADRQLQTADLEEHAGDHCR